MPQAFSFLWRCRAGLIVVALVVTGLIPTSVGAVTPSQQALDSVIANGALETIVRSGDTIYLGGNFNYLGPNNGAGDAVDTETGTPEKLPPTDGPVYAVVPDGEGGWFIGGRFTRVGDVPRVSLAHIEGSGQVSAWNPAVRIGGRAGQVNALELVGTTLYVGGDFSAVGNPGNMVYRPYLASVDSRTGAIGSFAPEPNGPIYDIHAVPAQNRIYVGGDFRGIAKHTQDFAAAFSNDQLTNWNPNTNGPVRAITNSGQTMYLGGDFDVAGGQPRSRLAAVLATTSVAADWDANANASVHALAFANGVVYVGGAFSSVRGQARRSLAALDGVTGALRSWNPSANAVVNALLVGPSTVYAGGEFDQVSHLSRRGVVAIDPATGSPTSWNPDPDGRVSALALAGTRLYVAGSYRSIGGVRRKHAAALDAVTLAPKPWNPYANAPVHAIAVTNDSVFLAGDFTNLRGVPRDRLAEVDKTAGNLKPWNPGADQAVSDAVVLGPRLYVGGSFSMTGGRPRAGLAAFDTVTGALAGWDPGASGGGVSKLAAGDGVIYAAGGFDEIGGEPRRSIAAIDATSGVPTDWYPAIEYTEWPFVAGISALTFSNSEVFVGGRFTRVNGAPRENLAAIDASSGLATPWNPGTDGTPLAILPTADEVYVGGDFTRLGGQPRGDLGAVAPDSGVALPWNPGVESSWVGSLGATPTAILAGGNFKIVNGQVRKYLAAFGLPAPT